METFYVNELGETSLDLKEVLDKCLFRSYCVAPLVDKKVCNGEIGGYVECPTWLHYMEEDAQREKFRKDINSEVLPNHN